MKELNPIKNHSPKESKRCENIMHTKTPPFKPSEEILVSRRQNVCFLFLPNLFKPEN
jgi:hypothetical protein